MQFYQFGFVRNHVFSWFERYANNFHTGLCIQLLISISKCHAQRKWQEIKQKKNGNRVFGYAKLDLLLGFGAHTYLHALSVILGVYIPYFAASLILLYKIG